MRYELAPMEGITGYIYRNAYIKYFGDMDRYYTPFIASTGLNHKELNDVLPEHNAEFKLGPESDRPRLVPQILTNRAEDFLVIADRLGQMGYSHVNLNLGCPSGTVVSRGRGAGFLQYPQQLDAFLAEIFQKCSLDISIKTRIGVSDTAQWEELLRIYAQYPVPVFPLPQPPCQIRIFQQAPPQHDSADPGKSLPQRLILREAMNLPVITQRDLTACPLPIPQRRLHFLPAYGALVKIPLYS